MPKRRVIKLRNESDQGTIHTEQSANAAQPPGETTSSTQPPTAENGYIIRKIKKHAISTKSLFSVPYLSEGITIRYSKKEDIPMLINEAVPSLSINSINKMWREMLTATCTYKEDEECVIFLKDNVQCNYTFNSLCLVNQGIRTTAIQVHPPTSNALAQWILFVPNDANPQKVKAFSLYNNSKHTLNFEDGVLRWTESSGNMDVIRAYIEDAESTMHIFDKLSDLDKQFLLLCAGTGAGKTTLINRMLSQAEQNQPDSIVLFLTVSDHSQLLDSGIVSHPLNFLKEAAKIVSPAQLSEFASALDEERLSVLFDCSDLISSKHLEKFCMLLQGLQKNFVKKVFVIGSNKQKKYLEDRLSTLAIDLCEFSNEDQKCALKYSWKDLLSDELDENQLDLVVNKILEAMSQGASELEKEFVGMPLLTHMIADVFCDLVNEHSELCEIPEKLGFLELFDRYVERNCNVANINDFQYIALDIVFGNESGVDFLHNENAKAFRESLQSNRYSQKGGIINGHRDGKPHFTHAIFADYFAAKWFASSVSKIANASDLLLKPEYRKTFFFYNRILAKDFQLHTAVMNDNLEHVKMLMGDGVDVNARDVGGRTALHLAAAQGVTKDKKVTASRNEILDLLILGFTNSQQEDNNLEITPLQYSIATQSWSAIEKLIPHFPATAHTPIPIHDQQMLDYILDNDLGSLMDLCFEHGFVLENTHDACKVLLPRSCELGSIRVATFLIKNGGNLWITYGGDDSPLHIAARFGHLEIVRLLVNTIKSVRRSVCKAISSNKKLSGTLPTIGKYTNMPTMYNDSALDLAMVFAHLDVVNYLQQEKAVIRDPNFRLQYAFENSKCDAKVVKVALDAVRRTNNAQNVTQGLSRAMLSAVRIGNIEMVRHILEAGGKATEDANDSHTPLMIAASWGHLDMVKFLLNKVPQHLRMTYINKTIVDGMTALRYAAYYGHAEVVAYLLEQDANKGPLSKLILIAAGNGNLNARVVELILSVIPSKDRARYINAGDNVAGIKRTAVYMAAKVGNYKALELLIQAGGKVTNPKGGTYTALMEAASRGHFGIVRLLVESAVKQGLSKCGYINVNYKGSTALQFAIQFGHMDTIKYLISEKAEINNYMEALVTAVQNVNSDFTVVDFILQLICDSKKKLFISRRDKNGNSLMHLAAKSGSVDMVAGLLKNGFRLNAVNAMKETPLMILASKGHTRTVKFLLDNFDEKKEGMTKLKYINLRNQEGLCAVSIANKNGHRAVMAFITQALGILLLNELGE